MTSAIQGTHARTEGRSWVETQTHAPLTARAPTAAPAPTLTLHAGPGTGLALSLKARKVSAVPDKPHRKRRRGSTRAADDADRPAAKRQSDTKRQFLSLRLINGCREPLMAHTELDLAPPAPH